MVTILKQGLGRGILILFTLILVLGISSVSNQVNGATNVRDGKMLNIIDKFNVKVGDKTLIETEDLTQIPDSSEILSDTTPMRYTFYWSDKKLLDESDKIALGDYIEVKFPVQEFYNGAPKDDTQKIYDEDGELIGHYTIRYEAPHYILKMIFDSDEFDYDQKFDYKGSFYAEMSLRHEPGHNGENQEFYLNINNEMYAYNLKPQKHPGPSAYRKWGELKKDQDKKFIYNATEDRYYSEFQVNLNQRFDAITNTKSNPAIVYDKLDSTIGDSRYITTSGGVPNLLISEYTAADSLTDIEAKKDKYYVDTMSYNMLGNNQMCTLYSNDPSTTKKNKDGSSAYSQEFADAITWDPANPDNFSINLSFLDNFDHPVRIGYEVSMAGVGLGDVLNKWDEIPGAQEYLRYISDLKQNSFSLTVDGVVRGEDKSGSNTTAFGSGGNASNSYCVLVLDKIDEETPTERLEGAEFSIFKQNDDSLVCTMETAANGRAVSEHLPTGDYYLMETKAPAGYEIDNQKRLFSLATSGENKKLLQMYSIPNAKRDIEATEKTVSKIWIDGDDEKNKRPDSIEAQLQGNGEDIGFPITLDQSNSWEYTWTDLPVKDDNDEAITYSVKEITKVKDYVTLYSDDGFIISNTFIPEKPTKEIEIPHGKTPEKGKIAKEVTVNKTAKVSPKTGIDGDMSIVSVAIICITSLASVIGIRRIKR